MDQSMQTNDPKTQEAVDTLQDEYVKVMTENLIQTAQVKTRVAEDELGTGKRNISYVLQPGDRVLGTFRGSRQEKVNGQDVITSPDVSSRPTEVIRPAFDGNRGLLQLTAPKQAFDIDIKMKELRTMPAGEDRQIHASMLTTALSTMEAEQQQRLTNIANQKSGVNDAQDALTLTLAQYQQAVAKGIIPPGAAAIEVIQAQKVLAAAQIVADRTQRDLILADPQINRFKSLQKELDRDMVFTQSNIQRKDAQRFQEKQAADRSDDKALLTQENRERQLPPMPGTGLASFAAAYDIKETDEDKLKDMLIAARKKDAKTVDKLVQMDKLTASELLTDPDGTVRSKAFKIVLAHDMLQLGEDKGIPKYLTRIEELIKDPTALMKPDEKKALENSMRTKGLGEAEKSKERQKAMRLSLNSLVEEASRNLISNAAEWKFVDPQLKAVVDQLHLKSKDGKVRDTDAYNAIMAAKMTVTDPITMAPREMSYREKINATIQSLRVTLQNEKPSLILPSVDNKIDIYVTDATNQLTRAFVRTKMGTFREPLGTTIMNNVVETFPSIIDRY